jgi:hypothetical protein
MAAELREPTALASGAARTAAAVGRRAALVLLAALFLAFSGAFGSGQAPLATRVLYWVAAIGAGAVVELALVASVFARAGWIERRPWLGGALRVAAISLPTTVAAWALFGLVFAGGHLAPRLLPGFLLPVVAVTAAMVALMALISRAPQTTHAAAGLAAAPLPSPAPAARLVQRLPPRLRGAALLAVEAEDHYLRLHTARGSELILLRLADALAELDGIEGAQVHRSWWVARAAVAGVVRDDGRIGLRLHGGMVAPVSRTYVKALRAGGWFDA